MTMLTIRLSDAARRRILSTVGEDPGPTYQLDLREVSEADRRRLVEHVIERDDVWILAKHVDPPDKHKGHLRAEEIQAAEDTTIEAAVAAIDVAAAAMALKVKKRDLEVAEYTAMCDRQIAENLAEVEGATREHTIHLNKHGEVQTWTSVVSRTITVPVVPRAFGLGGASEESRLKYEDARDLAEVERDRLISEAVDFLREIDLPRCLAENQRKEKAREAAQAAREQTLNELRSRVLEQLASDAQRAREADDLLAAKEWKDVLADYVYRVINAEPYVLLTRDDLQNRGEEEYYGDHQPPQFASYIPESCSDDVHAVLVRIRDQSQTIPSDSIWGETEPTVEIDLRIHYGWWGDEDDEPDDPEVRRFGIAVTVRHEPTGLRLRREFGAE